MASAKPVSALWVSCKRIVVGIPQREEGKFPVFGGRGAAGNRAPFNAVQADVGTAAAGTCVVSGQRPHATCRLSEAPVLQRERTSALKQLPILAELSDNALASVEQACTWRRYAAGEQVVGYRDRSTDVFFLLAGKVRVIIHSVKGKAVVFVDLKPPTMFGEIAAMDRKPRSASIQALEPCSIASLSTDAFEKLMLREPSVAVATLRHVAADVRRLSERVFEFSTLVVQNRIHAELLRLAGEAGARSGEVVLSPSPSLSDIANHISTHREAVSRELSRLTGIGLLRREGGNLHITNVAKLAEFVAEAKGE